LSIVYSILNLNNNKRYIGKTKFTIEKRWSNHCAYAKNNSKYHFHKAIRKYGVDCWILEILEKVDNVNLLNEREIYWINFYNTFNSDSGYNSTYGGDGGEQTEETKVKMRKKRPPVTKEWLLKQSLSHKGHIHSENTKKKMSESQKKRIRAPHSQETIFKMSEARKKWWNNKK
jgi:group I intron endonuclease